MKSIRISLLLIMTIIFLAGCIAIPIGDGNKLRLSKKGIIVTDEDGDEHSITIDEEEKSLSITGFGMDEDEGIQLGENLDLPETFPEEIPIANDAQILSSSSVGGNIIVYYHTDLPYEDVKHEYKNYYEAEAASFDGEVQITEQEDVEYKNIELEGIKGNESVHVYIEADEEGTTVYIGISNEGEA